MARWRDEYNPCDQQLEHPQNMSEDDSEEVPASSSEDEQGSLGSIPDLDESEGDLKAMTINSASTTSITNPLGPNNSSVSYGYSYEDEELIDKIYAAISYVRGLPTNSPPAAYNNFTFEFTNPPSTPLKLLRAAHNAGFAHLISESDYGVCYSIGVPLAPKITGEINPQWWLGKTGGEIRAGPFASEEKIKNEEWGFQRRKRRREDSRKKGRLFAEIKSMDEGLRRQDLGLRMCENDDGDVKRKKRRRS